MALTDLTRISTSGIATGSTIDSPILRKDVDFRGSQVGVTSSLFDSSDDALEFNDNVKLTFGNDGDLKLYHNGSHSFIDETGMGNLYIRNGTKNSIFARSDGEVILYHNDSSIFKTAETGAVVTGILTATSFSGPVVGNTNNTSGISTFYDLRVSNNLTVEGTTTTLDTNLIGVDRVNIGANSNTDTAIVGIQSGTADIVNLFDGTTEVLTVKDGGQVGIGTETPGSKLSIMGGSIGSGAINALELKHYTANNSGDGTAILFNGGYQNNAWAFAKISAVNSGTGFGGDLQVHIHPADGTQGSSVVQALSIVGDGSSGAVVRIPNGKVGIGTDNPSAQSSSANNLVIADFGGEGGITIKTNVNSAGNIFFADTAGSATGRIAYGHGATDAGDYMRFYVNSGEKVRIKHDGKVGIGTVNPAFKLDLRNTGQADLLIGSYNAGGARLMLDGDSNGDGSGGDFCEIMADTGGDLTINARNPASDAEMIFKTGGGTEKLRITSGGNVNIGTGETTQTARMLNVYGGAARVTQTTGGNTIEVFGNSTSGQSYGLLASAGTTANDYSGLFRKYDGTTIMKIRGDGNIGIGTNTPGMPLHLHCTVQNAVKWVSSNSDGPLTHYYNGAIHLGNIGNSKGVMSSTNVHFGIGSKSDLLFGTKPSGGGSTVERLRITEAGKVGIGSANPTAHLQVYRATQFASNPIIQASSNNGSTNELKFEIDGDGDAYFNGNIGINSTSPNAQFVLSRNPTTNHGIEMGYSSGGGGLHFIQAYNRATSAFTLLKLNNSVSIDSSGRVLINKDTSRGNYFNGTYSGKLQVEGTNDATRLTQFIHNSSGSDGHILVIGKSRGSTTGSYDAVQDDDYLGTISFQGADGDEMVDGARIEARVNGTPGNDDMHADMIFRTNHGTSSPRERLRITAKGKLLQRQDSYSETYQASNWGNAYYLKGGWMRFNSSFDNPTKDLVILADGGNSNNNLYIKVTVMHADYPGTQQGFGNIHIGYAYAKRYGDGTGKWYVGKSNMAVESGSDFSGLNSNVGTLSWENANNNDTNTLRYTSNRTTNYDKYSVQVEVWENGNCSYYLHSDFVE